MNSITLRFGTVKTWLLDGKEARDALQKWADHGINIGIVSHKDTPEQQQDLLNALEFMDKIWLDWHEVEVTKEEARKYILDYGKTNS